MPRLTDGALGFVWDDGSGRRQDLVAPAEQAIVPEVLTMSKAMALSN